MLSLKSYQIAWKRLPICYNLHHLFVANMRHASSYQSQTNSRRKMLRLSFHNGLYQYSNMFASCSLNKVENLCPKFLSDFGTRQFSLQSFVHEQSEDTGRGALFIDEFKQDQLEGQSTDDSNNVDLTNLTSLKNETLLLKDDSAKLESFADYGLGGWDFPNHWIQNLLEYLHYDMNIGWMPTIALATVALRFLALPAFIKMRSYVVRSQNHYPEQMEMQMKAMSSTNEFERQANANRYMNFMKENDVNPVKPLIFQIPMGLIFLSFFSALRGMAQAQLPSLMEGGAFWFSDLTIADPYFILPFLACTSMHLLIRYGAAAGEAGPSASIPAIQKYIMWVPFLALPFFIHQPSSMFIFWLTSNLFSFVQMKIFLQPRIQKAFGIPETIKHPEAVQMKVKNFQENLFNIRKQMKKKAVKEKSTEYQAAQLEIKRLQDKLRKENMERSRKNRKK